MKNTRGFFGIGIENTKTKANIGTLWRSAYALGAAFIFVIGERYKKQASDTIKAPRYIPMYHYDTFEEFTKNIPDNCEVIGVEIDYSAKDLTIFNHPERAIYLLGAEDLGLTKEAIKRCNRLVQIESETCLNVSVAGSIIMYDRNLKRKKL